MAIYKVRVKQSDLPPVPVEDKHLVRFRIVSVDENRTSHWVYKEVSGLGSAAPDDATFQADMV